MAVPTVASAGAPCGRRRWRSVWQPGAAVGRQHGDRRRSLHSRFDHVAQRADRPLMLGARDLAFPRLNLASWYLVMAGGFCALYALFSGGVDTGWTFYTPIKQLCSGTCRCGGHRHLHLRLFDHCHRAELHHHHSPPARPWPDLVSPAGIHLVAVFDQYRLRVGDSGAGDHAALLLLFLFETLFHVGVFDPRLAGDPLLFQHLFWFYSRSTS
jgi:cytochrome c oxidase subunit I